MSTNNFWIWGTLILLTTAGYFLSEQSGALIFLSLVSIITIAKVFLVAFQYMELKKAHPAWLSILGFILVVYTGLIIIFFL